MGPETDMLIQRTLYKGTICPVLFMLISLFLSDSGLLGQIQDEAKPCVESKTYQYHMGENNPVSNILY